MFALLQILNVDGDVAVLEVREYEFATRTVQEVNDDTSWSTKSKLKLKHTLAHPE